MDTLALKRTPLYPLYTKYGAKVVEFGGWEMPVQFSSILKEHEAVRTRVGLFDVSHMGEFSCVGPGAMSFLQELVTNDVFKLVPGRAMYSPMVNASGTTVDDLLIYCFTPTEFWIVVNAGNIDKDWQWMNSLANHHEVTLRDISSQTALLALQGPLAQSVLQRFTPVDLSTIRFYRFAKGDVLGVPCVISRTGYTGEDGFELYAPCEAAEKLWSTILADKSAEGVVPCGLGARDTLRLEATLPLYGHELTEEIGPLEAGLHAFVKLDKESFVGKDALAKQAKDGLSRRVVGLVVKERGIPRAGYRVFQGDKDIGHVTSGTMSPTLGEPIALAILETPYTSVGLNVEIDIRGKRVSATVVETPFYRRSKETPKKRDQGEDRR